MASQGIPQGPASTPWVSPCVVDLGRRDGAGASACLSACSSPSAVAGAHEDAGEGRGPDKGPRARPVARRPRTRGGRLTQLLLCGEATQGSIFCQKSVLWRL